MVSVVALVTSYDGNPLSAFLFFLIGSSAAVAWAAEASRTDLTKARTFSSMASGWKCMRATAKENGQWSGRVDDSRTQLYSPLRM